MCVVVEPEVIIVNLLKNDKRKYIEFDDIYDLCLFIKKELEYQLKNETLKDSVYFRINFEAIERTIIYNNRIYDLINDRIYYKNDISDSYIDSINNKSSNVVVKIIKDYIAQKAA